MEIRKNKFSFSDLLVSPLSHKYLLIAISAILALKALLYFVRAYLGIVYPFEWSTMDGYYVFHGLRLVSGMPIYFGYDSILTPFEYVPLYPAIIGVLAKIFGVGVWYERIFGLACAIGIAILVYGAVSKSNSNRVAALCSALMFFAPAALSVWFLVRGIDIFAALLALTGVFEVARLEERRKLWLVWPVALFVLAFYTKQTTAFSTAGVIAYLLVRKEFKRGFAVGVGFALASGALLLLFERMSGGWFFENAFVTTSMNPYYPWLLRDLFGKFSLTLFVVFPLAIVQSCREIRRPTIWTFYFLFTLFSAFLAGKAGAAMSYFIPLFSAVCIQGGLLLGDSRLSAQRPRLYAGILILFLVQSLSFLVKSIPVPTKENYLHARNLDMQIKKHPGPILTERVDSFATMNGRDLNVEAVQLPILVMRGKFDPEILIDSLHKKEFSLIVYSGIYFGCVPSIKEAIFENYRVIDRIPLGLFCEESNRFFLVLVPA